MRASAWANIAWVVLGFATLSAAAEPAPKAIARILPPPGVAIPESELKSLQAELDNTEQHFETVSEKLTDAHLQSLLPDVEIYLKAVRCAIRDGEFFNAKETGKARDLLKHARTRLDLLAAGKAPWEQATGQLVRGFRSQLDDSVQPYGLVIPKELDLSKPCPLYVWLHGRGDTATDLNFIAGRQGGPGEIRPANAIVLHVYGRYCNAFKFAGEVDVFEAMAATESRYKIDPNRTVLCGFSMGGAGVWHLAAHYPDRWAVATPGAGFAETRRYQNLTPDKYGPAYEQTLWGLYDAPDYVRNLFNLPLLPYSGADDKQIQSALVMKEAFAEHGKEFRHLIGPKTGHKYEPETLKELHKLLDEYAQTGINHFPRQVSLQTKTLRYNKVHWIEAVRLQQHWQDSRIDAQLGDAKDVTVTTQNVTEFRLTRPWADGQKFSPDTKLTVDGQTIALRDVSDQVQFVRNARGWEPCSEPVKGMGTGFPKMPGLQGPIDDVFWEPFLVVTPTGKSQHPQIEAWVQAELAHFQDRWRRLFRGELRTKTDTEVTPEDLKKYHVIVWGDRTSNQLFAQLAGKLPIQWTDDAVVVDQTNYPAATHVVSLIHPNPLSPGKYVVVNSGPTFREAHDKTNSQQNPKLPDWAVIDVTTPPSATQPGKVVAADFFDESWQLKPQVK